MKKYLLIILSLSFVSLVAYGQKKKKTGEVVTTISLADAISQYRFSEAENILNSNINNNRRKRLDVSELVEQLRAIQRAKTRMNVTEKICFIDSVVVPKSSILDYLTLSGESGSVDSYSHFFQKVDTVGCSVFLSQLGDRLLYAQGDFEGNPQLYTCSKVGGEWTSSKALAEFGLNEHGDVEQNYPYMLADGITLYFAAKGQESIGGYDIFMTRYDADEQHFLAPENIGMPFNSPANDYLYVVDEFTNLGWFVTDRNQPADTVCIYCFIPNESRRIYSVDELGEAKLRAFAKLNSISATWEDASVVNEAKQRLTEVRSEKKSDDAVKQSEFEFIINDKKTYTSISQFNSEEAKKQLSWWKESNVDLQKAEEDLATLRSKFAQSPSSQLATQIISFENKVRSLLNSIKKLENDIRRLENN